MKNIILILEFGISMVKLKKLKTYKGKKTRIEMKNKVLVLIYSYIILLILVSLYNFDNLKAQFILNYLIIPLLISAIISGILGIILESLSGNFFKKTFIYFKIFKFKIKISLFFLIVLSLTLWVKFKYF